MGTFNEFYSDRKIDKQLEELAFLFAYHGLDAGKFVEWYKKEGQHLNEYRLGELIQEGQYWDAFKGGAKSGAMAGLKYYAAPATAFAAGMAPFTGGASLGAVPGAAVLGGGVGGMLGGMKGMYNQWKQNAFGPQQGQVWDVHGLTGQGQDVNYKIQAATEKEAEQQFKNMGYFVTKVAKAPPGTPPTITANRPGGGAAPAGQPGAAPTATNPGQAAGQPQNQQQQQMDNAVRTALPQLQNLKKLGAGANPQFIKLLDGMIHMLTNGSYKAPTQAQMQAKGGIPTARRIPTAQPVKS